MSYSHEELENSGKFRLLLTIPFRGMLDFVIGYLRTRSAVSMFFWLCCAVLFILAAAMRMTLTAVPAKTILFHSLLGWIVFPLLIIPVHEFLHMIPYFLFGARKIRIGMDLKQYMFYVTAHRFVFPRHQFIIVALLPFLLINIVFLLLMIYMPLLWKWSLSAFLFVHATMCAGDFAFIIFYNLNKDKEIFTFDDADKQEAYFYEKLD
jgi:hypothetical protein